MTQDLIETFLAVMRCRNITAAARELYTSQTTVSSRLQQLEGEVGAQLFLRGKGQRIVEPTAAGEAFADVAARWMALFRETSLIGEGSDRNTVVVGTHPLIYSYSLAPIYRSMVASHPELRLNLRIHHSSELNRMVENRIVDIAYVTRLRNFEGVLATQLCSEPMVVLTAAESPYPDKPSPADLPAEREVYLHWGTEYDHWHSRHWPDGQSLVEVNEAGQIPPYLEDPGTWAIVPTNMARVITNESQFKAHILTEDAPPLRFYEIVHRYPRAATLPAIEAVRKEVHAVV